MLKYVLMAGTILLARGSSASAQVIPEWATQLSALAVDDSGNVRVTGESRGGTTHADYATIKYSESGAQLWVARYNGTAGDDDQAASLATDGSGNVYITGWSYFADREDEEANAVVVDASGGVWWSAEALPSGVCLRKAF